MYAKKNATTDDTDTTDKRRLFFYHPWYPCHPWFNSLCLTLALFAALR